MADPELLKILKSGVEGWNAWRREHIDARIQLSGADLSDAKLHFADLTGAKLAWAKLSATDLSSSGLSEADLSEVTLFETLFANVDLSEAIGLDSCRHGGPSVLDHRTLMQSGPLPLRFLCGAVASRTA
jgi:hypothetical protein